MRRGVRFCQWWMLLLATISGQGSLVGMERLAQWHWQQPQNRIQQRC
jgi:hypothetical protein